MVIFVVLAVAPLKSPGDDLHGAGGLDERHAARNSQDRRNVGPVREAWIDYEEGSIDTRSVCTGRGVDRRVGLNNGGEGLLPDSGNLVWTSVSQVATLTLCAAC
jgi:hypothetical protein